MLIPAPRPLSGWLFSANRELIFPAFVIRECFERNRETIHSNWDALGVEPLDARHIADGIDPLLKSEFEASPESSVVEIDLTFAR